MSDIEEFSTKRPKRTAEEKLAKKRRKKARKVENCEVDDADADAANADADAEADADADANQAKIAHGEKLNEYSFKEEQEGQGDYEEELEKTDFKVFVSRMPPKWDVPKIKEEFTQFGEVVSVDLFVPGREEKAEIRKDVKARVCYAFLKGECTRGEHCEFSHDKSSDIGKGVGLKGVIYFREEASERKALLQSTMHISARNIRIAKFHSTEDGRDITTCYAWSAFKCSRGDACIFAHEGPGSCVKVSAPGTGRAFSGGPCLSFKTKGKCSKGDKCTFQHVAKSDQVNSNVPINKKIKIEDSDGKKKTSGVCNDFRRKGSCRKGDNCKYVHAKQ